MHMEVKHDLSAGALVELPDGEAVGVERLLRGRGDLVGCARDMQIVLDLDVEDVAGMGLWYHQRMARRARHDVEKRQRVVVLIDLVAGELATQDSCKNVVLVIGGHGGLLKLPLLLAPSAT